MKLQLTRASATTNPAHDQVPLRALHCGQDTLPRRLELDALAYVQSSDEQLAFSVGIIVNDRLCASITRHHVARDGFTLGCRMTCIRRLCQIPISLIPGMTRANLRLHEYKYESNVRTSADDS